MTRDDRERLARNLASIVDELYVVPRPKERRLALVTKYIERAFYLGWRNRGGSIDEIIGPAT